ncbi:hypothetical protein D1AOALGA4SA_11634 [Olavius algarvensis Delta 1 endosymbiont]|nr:hypothetical protein D1AOALGA4SA_11634 [Olavius algarvensis Delta 1 endosymbiont]
MKYLGKYKVRALEFACLLFWTAGIIGFITPINAFSDNSVADEIISLNVTDQPLGEVLEDISIAANCQFSINESWEDHPVTVSFESEPLYRGLKLILRDINNAIIYGENRIVRIIIYDEGSPSESATVLPDSTKSPQDHIQQRPIFNDVTAPQPEVEISEDSLDTEEGAQQLEEPAQTDAELNENDADNNLPFEGESADASSEHEIGKKSRLFQLAEAVFGHRANVPDVVRRSHRNPAALPYHQRSRGSGDPY